VHGFEQVGIDILAVTASLLQFHRADVEMPHAFFQHDQAVEKFATIDDLPSPFCRNRRKSRRPVPAGFTRSSTTASASWRAATQRACGSTPATAPTSLIVFPRWSKPSPTCRHDGEAIVVDANGLFDLLRSWRYNLPPCSVPSMCSSLLGNDFGQQRWEL